MPETGSCVKKKDMFLPVLETKGSACGNGLLATWSCTGGRRTRSKVYREGGGNQAGGERGGSPLSGTPWQHWSVPKDRGSRDCFSLKSSQFVAWLKTFNLNVGAFLELYCEIWNLIQIIGFLWHGLAAPSFRRVRILGPIVWPGDCWRASQSCSPGETELGPLQLSECLTPPLPVGSQ